MKISLFPLLCCFSLSALSAQLEIQWQKTLGGSYFDQALCIQNTNDGGYIVTGNIASTDGDIFGNHGGYDFWVVKLSNLGTVQWKKAIGGSNNDSPHSIQQSSDGGYIVVGSTQSNNGDVSGNHGDIDGWVVKLNNSGIIEWQKTLGGSGWDEIWSVTKTSEGGYILAGRSNSLDGDVTGNNGAMDFWVVKISASGAIEWEETFGGTKDDLAYVVKQTTDSGYIVAGETASNDGDVTDNRGNVDYWVVKLTALGAIEWQKTLGGGGGDVAADVIESADGGYAVVGYAGSHNSGDVTGHHSQFDYWVVKLSNIGDLQWQKSLGGNEADFGRAIVQTNDGNFLVLGGTSSSDGDVLGNDGGADFWLVKLNQTGEIVWQKTFGGSQAEAAFSLQQTNDNGYILAGYAWSNDGDVSGVHGYNDFWVVKLSPESVGVNNLPDAQAGSLEIYPNPAQQSVFIKTTLSESAGNIDFYDLFGRNIWHQSNQIDAPVDISALADGFYIVVVTTPSGKTLSGTVMKQN